MKYFIVYNSDGVISQVYFGDITSFNLDSYIESDEFINPEMSYIDIDTLTVKNKSEFHFQYDSFGKTNQAMYFYDLPENTKIGWPDGTETIECGDVSFEINASGEYWIWFYNPKKITKRVIINVA